MQYTYYQLDASRLTLAELWRSCTNLVEFAIAVFCKLIHVNIAPRFGMARTDRLVRMAAGALPGFAQSLMPPLIQQAEALGMLPGFYFTIPTTGAVEGYSFPMRSADGRMILSIDCLRIAVGTVVKDKVTFHLISILQEGGYLITAGTKREEDTPPSYDAEHHPGQSIAEVLQRHQQRLIEQAAIAQVVADNEQLERAIFDYERGVMDFQIERGVFVPVSPDEVQRLKSLPRAADVSAAPAETSNPKPGLQWLEWGCWFTIVFGIFLFSKGDANQAQLVFRLALVGGGLVGVILFQVARLLRAQH